MSAADTAAGGSETVRVRVALPSQLRTLGQVTGEVVVEVQPPVTVRATLDALEAAVPTLVGAIRDRHTGRRRAMVRLYAAGEDFSDLPEAPLPGEVGDGREPLRLVGAIAGG